MPEMKEVCGLHQLAAPSIRRAAEDMELRMMREITHRNMVCRYVSGGG